MQETTPFIRAENIRYAYTEDDGRRVEVLRGLSVTIRRGEYVAVLGHNGSGKSTFAKTLNLIQMPDSGTIYIDGKDMTDPSCEEADIYEVRRKIGMVFQNPDNQLVATVVEEDVAFGPENLGFPPEEIRRRVENALSMVGMTEYARHEPHRLSGGQKQRVAIAGMLAMMPDCMIFDESTAMLDPIGRADVMEIMERLNREKGITVIHITHHMEEAVRAGRVIVLNDGEIYRDGTPQEVFAAPEDLRRVGLEVPQCTELVRRLREHGWALDGDATTPEACAALIAEAWRKKNT